MDEQWAHTHIHIHTQTIARSRGIRMLGKIYTAAIITDVRWRSLGSWNITLFLYWVLFYTLRTLKKKWLLVPFVTSWYRLCMWLSLMPYPSGILLCVMQRQFPKGNSFSFYFKEALDQESVSLVTRTTGARTIVNTSFQQSWDILSGAYTEPFLLHRKVANTSHTSQGSRW